MLQLDDACRFVLRSLTVQDSHQEILLLLGWTLIDDELGTLMHAVTFWNRDGRILNLLERPLGLEEDEIDGGASSGATRNEQDHLIPACLFDHVDAWVED